MSDDAGSHDVIDPFWWTGRSFWAPSPIEMLRNAWRRFLYPYYKCTDCIGMAEHGCYCDAMGAVAPGVGPQWWRAFLRGEIVL